MVNPTHIAIPYTNGLFSLFLSLLFDFISPTINVSSNTTSTLRPMGAAEYLETPLAKKPINITAYKPWWGFLNSNTKNNIVIGMATNAPAPTKPNCEITKPNNTLTNKIRPPFWIKFKYKFFSITPIRGLFF
ncbi:MAG: hypothetical protein EAZ44_10470 [Cytophagia bacterium]|nr:MAG: hypothetical protein EAZ44_10470 [Cytophagia bacterium]TAG45930.1 MAG: hypothetical protein EAZ31_01040 [Cytophagia bacterium]